MGIGGAIAVLFGFLSILGLVMCWLASRAPAGFEDDNGFQYGELPRRSAIPDQTFTDVPLRFAIRHDEGEDSK